MLPHLKIKFDNGNAGTVQASPDGVFGLVASAERVQDTFVLGKPYLITGMKDVAKLGIIPDLENRVLYRTLLEFYTEAGDGTNLWLMGMPKNTTVSSWFTPNAQGEEPIKPLLTAGNGNISCIITKYDAVILDGLSSFDNDIVEAIAKAQSFAESYTDKMYSPFFVLLEGYGVNAENYQDLPVLNERTDNRVAVFVGDTHKQTDTPVNYNQANHILAGRLAKIQVHENAGKVKHGALNNTTAFIGDEPVENVNVEYLHDKGYITFRTHVRKAGYYITDDPLATGFNDDYHYITRRRVIDKAYKIAYNIAINEVLNDIDIMPDGTLSPYYAKAVETDIESQIYMLMTARGELSANATDPNDLGVKATFNLKNNVLATGRVEMTLHVRPKGHNRFFEILLGYAPTKSSN